MTRPRRPTLSALPGGAAETAAPARRAAGNADPHAELVARAARGDEAAAARLYELFFHEAFREAMYLVGDATEAEDLVQEAFAAALAGLPSYEGRCGFGGWLRGILVNLARKHFRSRTRRRRALDRLRQLRDRLGPPAVADVERDALNRRRVDALSAVLETLPANMREVFVLVDLRGHPPAEVAKWLGIRPGTLRVRATRARQRIRRELSRLGWTFGEGGGA